MQLEDAEVAPDGSSGRPAAAAWSGASPSGGATAAPHQAAAAGQAGAAGTSEADMQKYANLVRATMRYHQAQEQSVGSPVIVGGILEGDETAEEAY